MGKTGTTATVPGETASKWLRRWDAQQERYVADREERFAVLCDVVEAALVDVAEPVVLDLGCGPGSLAGRLHERIPAAKIIGIDADPLLLGLARGNYGDDITWVNADLNSPTWRQNVPATIHAAVSTTALHWLPVKRLAELYRTLGGLMGPGGVFVDGDHMGVGTDPVSALAKTVGERRAARAGVLANEEWKPWWAALKADPALAEQVEAHEAWATEVSATRAADASTHSGTNALTVGEHSAMLTDAGFSSVAPVWQVGDDHVLVAVR
jgi:SAM-dependent methyltransferase